MKKKLISCALIAAMALSTAPAFAADTEVVTEDTPMLISAEVTENTPEVTASETLIGAPEISVDGAKIDLSKLNLSQYMYTENGQTMVPLRIVAETMGYTVGWSAKDNAVTISNDEWQVVLNIGVDSYYGVTKIKDAVGMTAPQTYGVAPQLIENTTFVPAKMFELMGYDFSIYGAFASFTKAGVTDGDSVQIPNPLISYDSIDAAAKVLGFKPNTPSYVPAGFSQEDISVIAGEIAQVTYTDKDGNNISYRVAKGSEDISGDYNKYSINKEVKVNGATVALHGNDKIVSAVWTNDGYTYAVFMDKGIDEADMINFVAGIK